MHTADTRHPAHLSSHTSTTGSGLTYHHSIAAIVVAVAGLAVAQSFLDPSSPEPGRGGNTRASLLGAQPREETPARRPSNREPGKDGGAAIEKDAKPGAHSPAKPSAQAPKLPEPNETKSVTKHPKVIGWPEDGKPTAPEGFTVTAFARDLETPRWMYVLPNGDVLVAQARTPGDKKLTTPKTSPNKITLLRDGDGDGVAEVGETYIDKLNLPFGMELKDDTLYVANTDGVLTFPYKEGETRNPVKEGKPIVSLPAGGYNNHWTRNLLFSADGSKLFISVGSASNVGENGMGEEFMRAAILQCNPDGTELKAYATGLRNPVGIAFEPTTGKLWTAVNERDELGDDLVPDYLTSVEEGGFYGWPYSYFGAHEDPRLKGERPDLVRSAIVPELAIGAHTASLGLAFCTSGLKAESADGMGGMDVRAEGAEPKVDRGAGRTPHAFPSKYRNGAFIGQRGSWNRSEFSGYKVTFVPFSEGKIAGPMEDFLTGFIANEQEVHGRPVGVAFAKDGSLLVADDSGNAIWRVAPRGAEAKEVSEVEGKGGMEEGK